MQTSRFSLPARSQPSSELSATSAPLDIFLLRGHSLPLPYLTSPAISFLVHLSPRLYLSLLRAPASNVTTAPSQNLPSLDIPFSILRTQAISYPRRDGTTIATLLLCPSSIPSLPVDSSMQALQGRPSFPLEPDGMKLDATLPEATEPSDSSESGKVYKWYLDFTDGGKHSGVVMSQSRMRDIENVLNPLGSLEDLDSVPVVTAGLGSWVDLLVSSVQTLTVISELNNIF